MIFVFALHRHDEKKKRSQEVCPGTWVEWLGAFFRIKLVSIRSIDSPGDIFSQTGSQSQPVIM